MTFLTGLLKILFIIATILLMAAPLAMEFLTFRRDKIKKISYKRFRIIVYTFIYIIAVTIGLYLLKEIYLWVESLPFVQWISQKIAFSVRLTYCAKVLAAILINFAIGILYVIFSKFVRIGLKKKNLLKPKKKNKELDWRQKLERGIIRFFCTETWFFVGRIVKVLSIGLSVFYAAVFVLYQIPALFGLKWTPYHFISMLFESGYIFPVITLLALWEISFFLEGIRQVADECPELLRDEKKTVKVTEPDLEAIDEEVRKQFGDYYACDADMSSMVHVEIASTDRDPITELIGKAVENDQRNPLVKNEVYLDGIDKLITGKKGILINGNFFSGFSMYFLRYLSAIIARGDNAVFVCNDDRQIDEVYSFITHGFEQISSLYCKDFRQDAIDFDEPIWRVIKVSGEHSVLEEASVDENNILVTSLGYLCSDRFEAERSAFIALVDVVVFVDALNTVNQFNRQLAMLNTRIKNLTAKNSLKVKNNDSDNIDENVYVFRYLSRQVQYICFDDTRTPGLDKVLKNLLSVDFESVDIMNYHPKTLVRCYRYEGKPDENGERICPHFVNTEEELGAVINMAILCLAKGASNVTVFTDNAIPYGNFAESIAANSGQINVKVDSDKIRLNKPFWNPGDYSVIIAVDSRDNLPAAVRKYYALVTEKPTLVIIFSRPYLMRDYYLANIGDVLNNQLERIPVEEETNKDIAQRILIKANEGGISTDEVLRLVNGLPGFEKYVDSRDVSGILLKIIGIYDEQQDASQIDKTYLYKCFEFISTQVFDDNGKYASLDKIILRREGRLFDKINSRDMIVMTKGDAEVILPLPRSRITQNYIAGQNLLYNGEIYYIQKINTEAGKIFARLAVGGKNDEAYRYVQVRRYNLQFNAETETVFPAKHVVLGRSGDSVTVSDVYISVFRTPMEAVTKGYYEVDPHSLSVNVETNAYHSIDDPGNDVLAKQTYRIYGKEFDNPTYSTEEIMKVTQLNRKINGALMMSLRICGQFGEDTDKAAALAAAMLNELFRSMFPSVADSVAVCPILHQTPDDEESQLVLRTLPQIAYSGETDLISQEDFDLVIIEDCAADLGVVSMLMSAGDDMLKLLFGPVFKYLEWYLNAGEKSDYLYYGLDHEPACFDFNSLYQLSELLGSGSYQMSFMDIGTIAEYYVCDFCGKHYSDSTDVVELDDGRKMCRECAEHLMGNNKKYLRSALAHARMFLESNYGIKLDDDYEFCFESTVKIINTLKMNPGLAGRGSDIPLKSYVGDKKKVHLEYDLPSASLGELLVRELTHTWQLKHLPELEEELAEGHIALVSVQYLRYLNLNAILAARTSYYESTGNISGVGYRRLVKELLNHPEYRNNPFRYLAEIAGSVVVDEVIPPKKKDPVGEYGLPYKAQKPDRTKDSKSVYFYRSRLSEKSGKLYDDLVSAIGSFAPTVEAPDFTIDEVGDILLLIQYDHPELFWCNYGCSMTGSTVSLGYCAAAGEAANLQKRIDEAAAEYLNGIDDSMSAYDVALRLHVKLISKVDYDTLTLQKEKDGSYSSDKIDYIRTICGVFLDGKAVCAGYSRAMEYMLQKCGIECTYVAGVCKKPSGEPGGPGDRHAWIVLKVDGDYYYLDTTWDDSSSTVQVVKNYDLSFDYFCVTEEELMRTRTIEKHHDQFPTCTATRANYFSHNDLVIQTYDPEKLKTIARTAAESGQKEFRFKCSSKALFDQMIGRFGAVSDNCYSEIVRYAAKGNKRIRGDYYHYDRDTHLWTITVRFVEK